MGRSSLLGIERIQPPAPGHDTGALGPSDSSDSGSDMTGLDAPDDGGPDAPLDKATADDIARPDTSIEAVLPGVDSDSHATGERRSAAGDRGEREADDIMPDRIIGEDGSEADLADVADDAVAGDVEEDEDDDEDEDADPVG